MVAIAGEIRKIENDVGQAALSPDGSRIVFERDQKLWQIGPNAESPVPLVEVQPGPEFTGHTGYFHCSALSWSPDGRWLTYVRKTGEADPLVLEARLAEDGRTVTILKDPDLRSYVWLSPTRIVLDRWEARDKPFSNLWQIDVDPKEMKAIGTARRLTNWAGFSVENMSASRDGRLLAITRETDQSNIFLGELSDHGNNLAHLHRVSPEDRVEWPGGWSADSKALFFQSNRTGNMNIFRQSIDSKYLAIGHGGGGVPPGGAENRAEIFSATNAQPLTVDQNDNRAPVLSPDKNWIIYLAWPRSSSQLTTASLMRKPLGGGAQELILEARGLPGSAQTSYRVVMPTMTGQPAFRCPWQIDAPCVVSEAGLNEVVFYSFAPMPGAGKSEIFRVQVDDPNSITWDLSPDGSRIGYAQYDWKSALIHVRELSTKTVRDIPLKDMTELSTLSWAADGKSFFATRFAVTGSSLYHVTLDGKYHVLYKGAKEVEAAKPSPDGHYLAFGDVVSASNVWLVEGFPQ